MSKNNKTDLKASSKLNASNRELKLKQKILPAKEKPHQITTGSLYNLVPAANVFVGGKSKNDQLIQVNKQDLLRFKYAIVLPSDEIKQRKLMCGLAKTVNEYNLNQCNF